MKILFGESEFSQVGTRPSFKILNGEFSPKALAHKANILIKGITTKLNVPIACPVRAYNRITGELLSRAHSKSDGSYLLFGQSDSKSYVLAVDPAGEYNIAVQDKVS
ncbi:hypothetical protein L291_3180 [Acinetobacter guillouiae MSP4-18]|uniref:hypothetical protein n=1 Tax=Acinetobacter guillouiae TaxID=106649 RepID=UPI0002D0AA02|nr:hypothetical protein [Acinetobacter guillouiae]ENU56848.1 hypothetical protein F981_03983 [Acinetobacter guillouiae CIP 63.46]EPH32521.1 hypothetical protein L291_3180 [Acinetobacter guillouiae MSP4-18]KAB0623912.1 hypothetical protein F7P82_18930 [Acinetobacter guillouiae]